MKTFLRSIAILFVFLGAAMFVQSPPPVKADWPCDLNGNSSAQACAASYRWCINNGGNPQDCASAYGFCLSYGMEEYADCMWVNGESPNPWPVIDEHRQWCYEGCQDCNQITNPVARLNCLSQCMDFCDSIYPHE